MPHKVLFTRAMLIRAVVKGVCLFAAFNLVYGLIQPAQKGLLPSLYNVVFAGRGRLIKGYEFDPYRLVSDHLVSRATSDTFNIVILGSSEIWGSRTGPAESIPAYLDKLDMVAADGRPVRVYNLGYPFPYAFKDLTIAQAAVQLRLPVDLVILSTFDATLSMDAGTHKVSSANVVMETDLIDRYGLPSKYFDLASIKTNDFGPTFLPTWTDRNALSAWASMQARGLVWNVMGDDIDVAMAGFRRRTILIKEFLPSLTVERIGPENTLLRAFAQFQDETHTPVIILAAPVPVETNDFAVWLHDQSQAVGLPVIDCWAVYRTRSEFEDYYHITREMHEPYARILAKTLSDAAFEDTVPGLPLTLPADFVQPVESCAVYPSREAAP